MTNFHDEQASNHNDVVHETNYLDRDDNENDDRNSNHSMIHDKIVDYCCFRLDNVDVDRNDDDDNEKGDGDEDHDRSSFRYLLIRSNSK